MLISVLIIVTASIGIGVLFGRWSLEKAIEVKVENARAELRAEFKQQQADTAVAMHGELSKIRHGIIDTALAYQNVVNLVGERLVAWEEVQPRLEDPAPLQIPFFALRDKVVSRDSFSRAAEGSGEEQPHTILLKEEMRAPEIPLEEAQGRASSLRDSLEISAMAKNELKRDFVLGNPTRDRMDAASES